jgi:hypothetical protein
MIEDAELLALLARAATTKRADVLPAVHAKLELGRRPRPAVAGASVRPLGPRRERRRITAPRRSPRIVLWAYGDVPTSVRALKVGVGPSISCKSHFLRRRGAGAPARSSRPIGRRVRWRRSATSPVETRT